MTKFCVKKPFIIIVAVIVIMIIGGVSLTNMQTDLLPNMELPYMLVITTEPGASPEKVEKDVTEVLESRLGTVSGVETIRSTSAENYSMVMLEFADDTDMNAALVRISQAMDSVDLPEECGKPNIMEIGMDMLATMYASVEYDGKDIKEITQFVNDTMIPYVERQEGVASVSASGTVEDSVEVKLSKKKIDKINDKILYQTNEKLAEAQEKIDDAEKELNSAKSELENQKGKLADTQSSTNSQLADGYVQISNAQATKAAYESSLNSLKASQAALEAEKKIYEDAKIEDTYNQMDGVLAQMKEKVGAMAEAMGITIPSSIEEGLKDKKNLKKVIDFMKQSAPSDQTKELSVESIEQLYNIVKVRIPQIDTELANLGTEIKAAEAVVGQINSKMKDVDDSQKELFSGALDAAAGFGSGQAQMAAGLTQIENAAKELEDGKKALEDSKKAAIENANIESLLTLETLSGIITSQNLAMPAGYVEDKEGKQWLVKVGENYTDEKELKDMVLTKIKGIGTIRLSDVAKVTVIDNAGESYAKMNGKEAVLLSIYKASTANTSEVSNNLKDAFEEMQEKNEGLEVTAMMDQADFITQMIQSILTSILFGAILAIIVLVLFLKDVKPTIIVAFSIPFSVLFAIVIMYFSGMTLNMMSLSGLCLGIGMLVDNSIVVVENVYRLRNKGLSPARAAVQGAKQVAAPIVASTLTTICVFLPMVFVSGIVSQILIPFALTITYALVASLIVALTVVPTFSSYALKKTSIIQHKIFDKMKVVYAKVLDLCLRFKIVPLAISILLLVICTVQAFRTGLEMIGESVSDQITITMTLDKEIEKDEAYARADEVSDILTKVKGIKKVAIMDGNATVAATSLGSGGGSTSHTTFIFYIIPEDNINTVSEIENIQKDIEDATKNVKCEELVVGSSGMNISALSGSGLEVHVYGDDSQKMIAISNDIMKKMEKIEGTDNISNGIEEGDQQIHLMIDKDKAAKKGLTVGQIFQQLAGKITTEKSSITLTKDTRDIEVNIVDKRDTLTNDNILDMKVTATQMNDQGQQVTKEYKLSKFAKIVLEDSPKRLTRLNQTGYMVVTAETKEGYNTTLMSRELEKELKNYKTPEGYSVEIVGESEQVMDMIYQLLKAIALGFVLIYLVMVAQFQSLLSPFIILFTIPLAFTGGMIGLALWGETISAMAMMGFMILMGTVVNNGIVFVDYVNQLRIQGLSKHEALIATGKTRMRPILMTAMTTILSMSVMVFSQDAGGATQKPMAIVVCFGLIYATFMTLFIIPIMYDILYRRQPHTVDVGDDRIDDIPDEVSEYLNELKK